MSLISTRTFSVFALIATALTLAACGTKKSTQRSGETEGIYVNVAQLKYQVEISRQLNPKAIPEDAQFVQGVSAADAQLKPGELWFAVFVRVENESDKAQRPATGWSITDTEGNTFRPVKIAASNPFAYSSAPIQPDSVAPNVDSTAYQVQSIGGMELLFKLTDQTLQNRPLELHIKSYFPDDEATDTLDV